jgi:two-component system, OmpR family, sensor histidine kinase KdpD
MPRAPAHITEAWLNNFSASDLLGAKETTVAADKLKSVKRTRLSESADVRRKAGLLQYGLVVAVMLVVSVLNIVLNPVVGVHATALIYLLAVVLLGLFVQRGPILLAASLSAVVWDYFFLPPVFAFRVSHFEDALLLVMYFLVAIILGQLTTRIRAQQEAERNAQLIAESERLGKSLMDSMTHEIRTPIAAIKSATGNLLQFQDIPLSGSQKAMVAEIHEAIERLNRLVGNVLDVTRLDSGHFRPKISSCDVRDLVQVVVKETKKELAEHPLTIEIAPNVPLVAPMDFVLTQQALMILLSNAAFHTPPKTAVLLRVWRQAEELVFEVSDHGPGISEESLPRVFEKFYRAPNARAGGTGLGLSLAKGFVEAQNGRIEARNASNGGAVFTIRLPLEPKEPDEWRS